MPWWWLLLDLLDPRHPRQLMIRILQALDDQQSSAGMHACAAVLSVGGR